MTEKDVRRIASEELAAEMDRAKMLAGPICKMAPGETLRIGQHYAAIPRTNATRNLDRRAKMPLAKGSKHGKAVVGARFGRLVVAARAGATVQCICDCGNLHTTSAGNVTFGHTQSCGCLGREARTSTSLSFLGGRTRFGILEFLREVEPVMTSRGRRARKAACRCDCGSVKIIDMENLRRGKIVSCGCVQKRAAREHLRKMRER